MKHCSRSSIPWFSHQPKLQKTKTRRAAMKGCVTSDQDQLKTMDTIVFLITMCAYDGWTMKCGVDSRSNEA